MKREFPTPTIRWASPILVAGGSLMMGLWLIFTTVHGPTSYNLDRPFLGQSMQFWGVLLGGPPNLLARAALSHDQGRVVVALAKCAQDQVFGAAAQPGHCGEEGILDRQR